MRGVVLQKASKTSLLQAEARPPRAEAVHRPPGPPQAIHRVIHRLERITNVLHMPTGYGSQAIHALQMRGRGSRGRQALTHHLRTPMRSGRQAPAHHGRTTHAHTHAHPRTRTGLTQVHTQAPRTRPTHTRAVGRCLVIFHKHGIIGCRSRQRGVMCQTYSAGHGALEQKYPSHFKFSSVCRSRTG